MEDFIALAIDKGGVAAISQIILGGIFLYIFKAMFKEIIDARKSSEQETRRTRKILSGLGLLLRDISDKLDDDRVRSRKMGSQDRD